MYRHNQNTTSNTYQNTSTQLVNREGYIAHIWSTISHVASSGPKYFHFTLTSSIALFQSMICFRYKMNWGSRWNYPSGSTCNTNQWITNILHVSFKQSNMKNIMDFHYRRQCKLVPIHSRILKGLQYRGANLTHDPILKELLLGLMCKYTCSPTWKSLNSLCWSA